MKYEQQYMEKNTIPINKIFHDEPHHRVVPHQVVHQAVGDQLFVRVLPIVLGDHVKLEILKAEP